VNLGEWVIVIKNKRRNKSANEQKLDFESIQIWIVSWSEWSFHEVENVNWTGNEENLHYSIVYRYPWPKEIYNEDEKKVYNTNITRNKDYCI